LPAEGLHPADGSCERRGLHEIALPAVHDEACSERLRQIQHVMGTGSSLAPDTVGMDRADDGEPVGRLLVPERVAAREDASRFAHLLARAGEDGSDGLDRQLFGEDGDRERDERSAAHCEDVAEGVRRRDRPVVGRVVDDRREEVEREDERALVVEPVHGCVVGRCEPDEEVVCLGRREAREELLQACGRVLRGAAAAGGEVGEPDLRLLHAPGL
jgi:hypothetical protein